MNASTFVDYVCIKAAAMHTHAANASGRPSLAALVARCWTRLETEWLYIVVALAITGGISDCVCSRIRDRAQLCAAAAMISIQCVLQVRAFLCLVQGGKYKRTRARLCVLSA